MKERVKNYSRWTDDAKRFDYLKWIDDAKRSDTSFAI